MEHPIQYSAVHICHTMYITAKIVVKEIRYCTCITIWCRKIGYHYRHMSAV